MRILQVLAACLLIAPAFAAAGSGTVAPITPPVTALKVRSWRVDGVARQALVYVPPEAGKTGEAGKEKVPVVFAFHGHGGGMRSAAATFAFHMLWPQAIAVYPQGLPSPGIFDPDGRQAGWQKTPGDGGDRDLRFFDAMLGSLKRDYKVDEGRVYATGHSNGGAFTYLLWAMRGDELAAVAPSAAGSGLVFRLLKPLPALHVAGEQDEVVPFANQQRTMERIRRLNGCEAQGQPWAQADEMVGTLYPSKSGTPFVSLIHPGGHQFPGAARALIVRFFKEHAR